MLLGLCGLFRRVGYSAKGTGVEAQKTEVFHENPLAFWRALW